MLGRRRDHGRAVAARAVFGVGLILEAPQGQILEQMLGALPPCGTEIALIDELPRLTVTSTAHGYALSVDGSQTVSGDLGLVLEALEQHARNLIAFNASEHVFVHAGVVAHANEAIILPGASFSGKTTLVAALVQAGATYYSDEYAVIDSGGLVHPFPKPLAIRLSDGEPTQTNHDVAELGGVAGTGPVPVAVVAFAQYRPGADWRPVSLSPAETVLDLFGNAYMGADRPGASLPILRRAVEGALGLKGERGEARPTAVDLLARIAAQ